MGQILSNRTALVTGGTRGIGRSIVTSFLNEGATSIHFTYRKSDETAAQMEAEHEQLHGHKCTGHDRAEVDQILDAIRDRDGQLDILVNNAGITANTFFAMSTSDDWERIMQTNVTAVHNWCRAAIRPMLGARKGTIINIASVSGIFGVPGQSAYGASKGAILAFTRALAAETSAKGIRVNAVVPGFIETDMSATIPRSIKRKYLDRIALGRFGSAEEVASVTVFLASDLSSYITGQAILVDGGLTSTVQ
jgi:3-oxoacyl-[acyl-carrier protein] reductase